MEYPISFEFKGLIYRATVCLSLEEDNGYVFTILKDNALIASYGSDVDFKTDGDTV